MLKQLKKHETRLKALGLFDQGADLIQQTAPLSERERKYCRCLVKATSASNPYAVCTKSVGRAGSVQCFAHYNLPRFDEGQLNALTRLHKKSGPKETVKVWLSDNEKKLKTQSATPKSSHVPRLLIKLLPYFWERDDLYTGNANLDKLVRQRILNDYVKVRELFNYSNTWDVVDFAVDNNTLEISVTLMKKDKSRFTTKDIQEVVDYYENRPDTWMEGDICILRSEDVKNVSSNTPFDDDDESGCFAELDVGLISIDRI